MFTMFIVPAEVSDTQLAIQTGRKCHERKRKVSARASIPLHNSEELFTPDSPVKLDGFLDSPLI